MPFIHHPGVGQEPSDGLMPQGPRSDFVSIAQAAVLATVQFASAIVRRVSVS